MLTNRRFLQQATEIKKEIAVAASPFPLLSPVPSRDHSKAFNTWSYETNQPLSLKALREAARKLPGNIFRYKGVIHSADVPERRAVLQVVGRRVDISMQEEWGEHAPRTQIVAIGTVGSIDTRILEETFASCISPVAANIVA